MDNTFICLHRYLSILPWLVFCAHQSYCLLDIDCLYTSKGIKYVQSHDIYPWSMFITLCTCSISYIQYNHMSIHFSFATEATESDQDDDNLSLSNPAPVDPFEALARRCRVNNPQQPDDTGDIDDQDHADPPPNKKRRTGDNVRQGPLMDLQQQQQRRVQQQVLQQQQLPPIQPHLQPPPQQVGPIQGQAPQVDGDQVQINHQSLQLLLQMATNNTATQQAASNRDLLEQNAKLLELLTAQKQKDEEISLPEPRNSDKVVSVG